MVLTAKGIIIFTYTPTDPAIQPFGLVLISFHSIRLRDEALKTKKKT